MKKLFLLLAIAPMLFSCTNDDEIATITAPTSPDQTENKLLVVGTNFTNKMRIYKISATATGFGEVNITNNVNEKYLNVGDKIRVDSNGETLGASTMLTINFVYIGNNLIVENFNAPNGQGAKMNWPGLASDGTKLYYTVTATDLQ